MFDCSVILGGHSVNLKTRKPYDIPTKGLKQNAKETRMSKVYRNTHKWSSIFNREKYGDLESQFSLSMRNTNQSSFLCNTEDKQEIGRAAGMSQRN